MPEDNGNGKRLKGLIQLIAGLVGATMILGGVVYARQEMGVNPRIVVKAGALGVIGMIVVTLRGSFLALAGRSWEVTPGWIRLAFLLVVTPIVVVVMGAGVFLALDQVT